MKSFIVSILIVFFSINSVIYSQDLRCASTSTTARLASDRGGIYLPASGTLKVLIVFARMKDDNASHNYWTAGSPPPNYQSYIDSTTTEGSTNYLNLTNYFKRCQWEHFMLLGKLFM